MKRLAHARELLDGPLEDPRALRDNLRDLRRINRLLGGVGLSSRAVQALAAGRNDVSLIDVGTGAADIPLALVRSALSERDARAIRSHVSAIAVDSREEVLDAARSLEPALDRTPGLQLCVGDGRGLDWPDRSFDIAHASLVLHHLEPPEAVEFLRELGRVARLGVVVNDLRRGWAFWAWARVGTPIVTGNRLTRHDAPLSVRRSYTAPEMRLLLREAGLRPVATWHGPFRHRFAMAAVREAA